MLTEKHVSEIKEHLEKAQNPIFFFHNDQDGLCSFLLLQKWIGRGKGIAVKTFPALDESYFRKVQELGADYVFVLDVPLVSKEFFNRLREVNIPVVWIDHHDVQLDNPDFVNYYNPFFNGQSTNEPVAVLCYQITGKKSDLWIATIGAISDGYFPEFYPEFLEKYPDLGVKTTNPFQVLYESKIGEIAVILSGGLKDKTSNVISMLKFLMKVKSPYEILEENGKTYSFHRRANQINQKYQTLLNKAKNLTKNSDKLLFFKYSGDLSISGELSNELMYRFPGKLIVVAYIKGSKVNLSLRGENIKGKFLEAIKGIEGATGGGHKDAVGGQMQADALNEFKKNLEKQI
ncbi:MAG: DHHA1 domain-containing protein [archaeon]